jgi:transcriptional regulator with XRE-family HTH domain
MKDVADKFGNMTKIGIDKRFRANLIRLRMAAGLDQNGLAKRSGVSHIAQIESGARPIGKNVMTKLAKALDVDISEFFTPDNKVTALRDSKLMLLELFTSLSPSGQRLIEEMVVSMLKYEKTGKIF